MKEIKFFYKILNDSVFIDNYKKMADARKNNLHGYLTGVIYKNYYSVYDYDKLIEFKYNPEVFNANMPVDDDMIDKINFWKRGEMTRLNYNDNLNKLNHLSRTGIVSILPNNAKSVISSVSLNNYNITKIESNRLFVYGNSNEQSYKYKSRFYLVIGNEFKHKAVEYIYNSLNYYSIPFLIKIFTDVNGARRSDNFILYLNPAYCNLVFNILSTFLQENPGIISKGKNLHFAKKVAPGLYFGESPKGGDSFGFHRSQAMATLLINAFSRLTPGHLNANDYKTTVREVLDGYGINHHHIFLNGSYSKGYYSFL